jgi:hypothetical protein
LRTFAREGRLTSQTLPSAKLYRLRQAGVIVNSTRGVYVIAPQYAVALRTLALADRVLQGF